MSYITWYCADCRMFHKELDIYQNMCLTFMDSEDFMDIFNHYYGIDNTLLAWKCYFCKKNHTGTIDNWKQCVNAIKK